MTKTTSLSFLVLAFLASGFTPAPAEPPVQTWSFSRTHTLTSEKLTVAEKEAPLLVSRKTDAETSVEETEPQS
jgi:hypothetical protein